MEETTVKKSARKKKNEEENLENLTMDETYARLDALLNEMETGNHSLEESFALYSRGIALVQACSSKIDRIEKELIILENREGADE